MRVLHLAFALLLAALTFGALNASAACEVVTVPVYWDVNYATVCALHEYGFGDGTQEFAYDYVLHARHAAEADPVFTFWEAQVARGTWSYDDGEVSLQREWVQVGSGLFVGARGLVGGGYHLYLDQRDQTAGEDAAGYCSSVIGRSTCFGAGAWLTVQPLTSVGAAAYYHQVGEGPGCTEQYEVDLDVLGTYIPTTTEEKACELQMPWLYDAPLWDAVAPV